MTKLPHKNWQSNGSSVNSPPFLETELFVLKTAATSALSWSRRTKTTPFSPTLIPFPIYVWVSHIASSVQALPRYYVSCIKRWLFWPLFRRSLFQTQTGHRLPNWGFLWFYSVPPRRCQIITLNSATIASCHILPTSLIHYDPIIRRYTVWDTNRVVTDYRASKTVQVPRISHVSYMTPLRGLCWPSATGSQGH